MIGAITARGMNSSSVFTEARTDDSCRCSRSIASSARTSRSLRTPMLISLPRSSVNMRTEPDLTTSRPSAGSFALHTVSPNEKKRDSACCASCSISARVNGEKISTDARKSARDRRPGCASMCNLGLARRDDVFLRPRREPFLAEQAPYLGRGVLVQHGGLLRVHREDLVERPVGRRKRSEQVAGGRVEHLGLDVGLQRTAHHFADRAAVLARVRDRMLAGHLGKAVRIVAQQRHHFLRLAFGIEDDVAHFDAFELRGIQLEVLVDRLLAADVVDHLFLVEAIGDEGLELVEADAEGVEVAVGVDRAVQSLHAPKLIRALLYFFGRYADALLLRRPDHEPLSDELLDETFELPGELQCPDEAIDADHFVIDSYDRCHHPSSIAVEWKRRSRCESSQWWRSEQSRITRAPVT